MIRNVIFDWSGTLVDDLPAVWHATNHVFAQAGLPEMTLDCFRAEFCLPFTRFYQRYTPDVPMAQLEAWFHGRFKEVQDSVVELPHARGFLEFCRDRGLRTFLLSTVHRDHFAVQTARNRFDEFLDRPYIEVWDKRAKIHEILTENKLAPTETLFIGDMEHDIETAKHGGIFSCAVLTGYNRLDQLRAAQPDLIVEHLGELRDLIERDALKLGASAEKNSPDRDPRPIVTVGALIFNDAGEVLMIRTHKWSNLWGIPGGKTKWGETSVEALRREIREETALEIRDIEFVLVQDCIHSREFYRDAHFVLLNYTCRCVGAPQVVLNDEAREFRWLPLKAAFALPLNQPTLTLLHAVQNQAESRNGKSTPSRPI
ncbi:MAG: NUDIX domain-containing protein [Verrucomicrobia bacterium]|nr:NUDIX domain-containing protein [Verrucomicrobiota bacterium]